MPLSILKLLNLVLNHSRWISAKLLFRNVSHLIFIRFSHIISNNKIVKICKNQSKVIISWISQFRTRKSLNYIKILSTRFLSRIEKCLCHLGDLCIIRNPQKEIQAQFSIVKELDAENVLSLFSLTHGLYHDVNIPIIHLWGPFSTITHGPREVYLLPLVQLSPISFFTSSYPQMENLWT